MGKILGWGCDSHFTYGIGIDTYVSLNINWYLWLVVEAGLKETSKDDSTVLLDLKFW